MRSGRIIALVVGCLLVLPALALLIGGAALAGVYAAARDDSGYVNASVDRLSTSTAAITTDDFDFGSDAAGPDPLVESLDVVLRLRVTSATGEPVFVGVGRAEDVEAYLSGAAHDVVADVTDGGAVSYRHRTGTATVSSPADEGFWVRSEQGTGSLRLDWSLETGSWSVVLMNVDGSPGVSADVEVGTKAGFVLPLGLTLAGVGLVVLAVAVVLIVVGASQRSGETAVTSSAAAARTTGSPVAISASLDPGLSRWQWLVKWFLAIPHFIVLAVLWVAFGVLTVAAFFAILVTGRYPRGIFDFNVGVLRWTWRVSYYATSGGLGTDRYPRFGLSPEPSESAQLEVAYPEHLSRGLVLVKWWLLAIPHYLVLSVLVGGTTWWFGDDGGATTPGLLGLLVLISAVALLFTGRYPTALFDLVVGLNRWLYRVIAYVALMTDSYPPFRLDQGGAEPPRVDPDTPSSPPGPGTQALPVPEARGSAGEGLGSGLVEAAGR